MRSIIIKLFSAASNLTLSFVIIYIILTTYWNSPATGIIYFLIGIHPSHVLLVFAWKQFALVRLYFHMKGGE